MPVIQTLAEEYLATRPTNVLDEESITALIIEAVVEYQAWGALEQENLQWGVVLGVAEPVIGSADVAITEMSEITPSEWGVVKPMAYLLIEKQEAMIQEASKNHMHEAFGRSTSEIEQDIVAYRNDQMRRLAFFMPVTTV